MGNDLPSFSFQNPPVPLAKRQRITSFGDFNENGIANALGFVILPEL